MTVKELKEKLEGYNEELTVRIINFAVEFDEGCPTYELLDVQSSREFSGEDFDETEQIDYLMLHMYDEDFICK